MSSRSRPAPAALVAATLLVTGGWFVATCAPELRRDAAEAMQRALRS